MFVQHGLTVIFQSRLIKLLGLSRHSHAVAKSVFSEYFGSGINLQCFFFPWQNKKQKKKITTPFFCHRSSLHLCVLSVLFIEKEFGAVPLFFLWFQCVLCDANRVLITDICKLLLVFVLRCTDLQQPLSQSRSESHLKASEQLFVAVLWYSLLYETGFI